MNSQVTIDPQLTTLDPKDLESLGRIVCLFGQIEHLLRIGIKRAKTLLNLSNNTLEGVIKDYEKCTLSMLLDGRNNGDHEKLRGFLSLLNELDSPTLVDIKNLIQNESGLRSKINIRNDLLHGFLEISNSDQAIIVTKGRRFERGALQSIISDLESLVTDLLSGINKVFPVGLPITETSIQSSISGTE